ncbi:hypothetical protein IG631_24218 [Alternaria alternata]|nr:hypothetical protein IG631_24218 [Alternaria alternata]
MRFWVAPRVDRHGITTDRRESVKDTTLGHQANTSTSSLLLVVPEPSSEEWRANTRALSRMFLSCNDASLFCEWWDSNWKPIDVVEAIEATVIIQSKLCTAHKIWICQ